MSNSNPTLHKRLVIWWGGGGAGFLRDQPFSTPSQNVYFFRPYEKQTIFCSAVEHKTFFSPFILFIISKKASQASQNFLRFVL